MQKNHFELSIDCDSEQEAKCIASSMQLELNQPFEKRSKTKIQSKKNALMVFIRSEDSKSLRASIQSHAKLAIMLSSIPGGN